MTLPEAADTLVRLGTDFYRRGWVLGTSGNFSAVIERDPLRLAITSSSVDKGRMNASQILTVNAEGQLLTGSGKPSAETLLHLEIVRSTGASAVLHTHSVWSTVLSDYHSGRGGFYIEGYEMLKGLEGVLTHEHREWIPIVENDQDMAALSLKARSHLQEQPQIHCLLVQRHGLYAWGKDLSTAQRHIEILEFLLEAVGRRQMMEPSH